MRRIAGLILMIVLVAVASALPSTAIGKGTLSGPRFETIGSRLALVVDEKPYLVLGLQDFGFSRGRYSDPYRPDCYEEYFDQARLMGFNTVVIDLTWSIWEYEEGVYDSSMLPEDARILSGTGYIEWAIERAEAKGLKVILGWFGSNIGGVTNAVPRFIYDDPAFQRALTVSGEEAGYYNASGDGTTGYYCWNYPSFLEREAVALRALMSWIAANNANQTIVMLRLQNEIGFFSDDHPSIQETFRPADRCYCTKCLGDFPPAETGPEEVAQTVLKGGIAFWAAEIQEAYALAGGTGKFPIYINDFERPVADGTITKFGTPSHDVAGWLTACDGNVGLIGPDIYYNNATNPHGPAEVYQVAGNGVFTPEHGVTAKDGCFAPLPWNGIFPLLGDERFQGIGSITYQLYGPNPKLTACDPQYYSGFGGLSGYNNINHEWVWYEEGKLLRNSFLGLADALNQVAAKQGTDDLFAFSGRFWPSCDEVFAGSLSIAAGPGDSPRGIIVRRSPQDYVFVGVSYSARINHDVGVWDVIAERGWWDVDGAWHPVAVVDAVPDGETGNLVIQMPEDDLTQDDLTMDHRYCVRVRARNPAADFDADGVEDALDNCPETPNGGQQDADADSVGDACDSCPLIANAGQGDIDCDGDGNLCDADRDGDGEAGPAGGGLDCNDEDPCILPLEKEGNSSCADPCFDSKDNDCDGQVDEAGDCCFILVLM